MKRSKTTPETIGERLRKAREKLGLSTAEVAQRTKIHPRIVAALEADQDVARLSPVYVKSFVRMYARAVGLDERETVQEFAEQHPVTDDVMAPQAASAAPAASEPPVRASMSVGWRPTREQVIAVVVLLMAILGIGGVVSWFSRHPLPKRVARPPVAAARERAKSAASRMGNSAAVATLPAVTVPAQEPLKLQLTAKERTWLRVTADGKVIFQNVLDKGHAETWTAAESLVLWLGNAGGVELTLNGHALGAPGRRGEVIRDLRVTHSGVQIKR